MFGRTYSNLFIYTSIFLACLLTFLSGPSLQAQNSPQPAQDSSPQPASPVTLPSNAHDTSLQPVAADLANTSVLDDISGSTWLYFSNSRTLRPEQLPSIVFPIKGTKKFEHFIPVPNVDNKAILKFTLANSSDHEQRVFICPGFYYDSIQLYRLTDRHSSGRIASSLAAAEPSSPLAPVEPSSSPGTAVRVEALPSILPPDNDSLGYRQISLRPHDTATFFAALTFIKSPTNSINPTLTRDSLIHQGVILNHHNKTSIDVITNLFAGIMLMMIFYAFSEYLQTSKPEFLYYAGYCLCISALLFLKSTLHSATVPFNFFFESFLDNIIFSIGYIFYIVFHRKFLETKKSYRSLDRFLFWGVVGIAGLTILYAIFFFFSPEFEIANTIENATKILLLIICLGFSIIGSSYRNQLMNYIVMGNVSLFLLSIISQVIISTNFHLVKSVSVLNLALFYYEVGITIELLFFLFALTYKNKMEIILSIQKEEKLKLETERKELEKQVAVLAAKQDERNRISADMHDELGSGVTAIRLMSEIVKSKMKEQTLPEIEKISHSANELLNKMNTIIWTMTSSNDSVENLVAYIRSYAVEFFESTTIDCYFSMPASIPHKEISGEKRRNMFLSVKESLNNVLKHSQSSVVKINVLVNERLIIEIQDDGVGINMEKLRKFGNGLSNMRKRMASIDGEFNIENRDGTRTVFGLLL